MKEEYHISSTYSDSVVDKLVKNLLNTIASIVCIHNLMMIMSVACLEVSQIVFQQMISPCTSSFNMLEYIYSNHDIPYALIKELYLRSKDIFMCNFSSVPLQQR